MFMEGFNMPAVSKELLKKLYMDLRNERKHMMFYLTNASTVQGLESIEVEFAELELTSFHDKFRRIVKQKN